MSIEQAPSGKWRARLIHDGTRYWIGLFGSREAAEQAVEVERDKVRQGLSLIVFAGMTSLQAFAEERGIALGTVKRWVHEGMPVERHGVTVRIRPEVADAWIASHRAESLAFNRRALVYAMQRETDWAVKIGWSSDPERRIAEVAKAFKSPTYLVAAVPGSKTDELALHRRFEASALGGEWFAVSADEVVLAMVRMVA